MKSAYLLTFICVAATISAQSQEITTLDIDSLNPHNLELDKDKFHYKSDSSLRSLSLSSSSFDMDYALKEDKTNIYSQLGVSKPVELNNFHPKIEFTPPNPKLFELPKFPITGTAINTFYGVNFVKGVKAEYNLYSNNKLTIDLMPSVFNSYNELHRNFNPTVAILGVGVRYQVNDWLTVKAIAQQSFNIYRPNIPGCFFDATRIGVGADFRVTDWMSMSVAVNYIRQKGIMMIGSGGGGGVGVGGASVSGGVGFDLDALYDAIFKKKKKEIPEIWW